MLHPKDYPFFTTYPLSIFDIWVSLHMNIPHSAVFTYLLVFNIQKFLIVICRRMGNFSGLKCYFHYMIIFTEKYQKLKMHFYKDILKVLSTIIVYFVQCNLGDVFYSMTSWSKNNFVIIFHFYIYEVCIQWKRNLFYRKASVSFGKMAHHCNCNTSK